VFCPVFDRAVQTNSARIQVNALPDSAPSLARPGFARLTVTRPLVQQRGK
jgi:hypothetical protein